jgi:hypothetical protein
MKKLMRIFVVLICSLGLVSVAYTAQPEENKSQKKKQPQTVQHAPPSTTGHPAGAGAGPKKTQMGAYEGKKGQTSMGAYQGQTSKKGQTATGQYQGQTGKKGQTSTGQYHGQTGKKGQTATGQYEGQKGKKGQTSTGTYQGQTGKAAKGGKVTGAGKPTKTGTVTTAGTAKAGKPLKPQHFNVPKQPNTAKAPPVKFQQGKHIEGSQNWQGQQYTVFRNYKSEWHDQGWWHSHYNNIVFVFGAPYFWNAGYWFPAWGYYPNAYYAWDGPIYGYNHLPPDQVIANVQAALQQQGYYHGEVDGLIGPLTREAIADYQRGHGLYETAAIDQPTLQSLGMA